MQSRGFFFNVYTETTWQFGSLPRRLLRIFCSERATIAERQGASENKDSEVCRRRQKPNCQVVSVYSLAPYLIDEGGHDVVYHEILQDTFESIGSHCEVLVSEQCALKKNGWKPFFSSKKRRFREFFQLLQPNKRALFFLESFSLRDLLSLAAVFLIKGRAVHTIVVLLRYDLKQLRLRGCLHRSLLLLMKLKGRLLVFTDSSIVQNSYPSQLLPIPHTEGCSMMPGKMGSLWWPGSPRPAKGLKEIQQLVRELSSEIDIEITVAETALIDTSISALRKISHPLSRSDYLSELQRCQGVLLPYDPIAYKGGTSGIFVEAIVAGKIPFVRDGTWMAQELKRFDLSELILNWNSPNLLKIISTLLKSGDIRTKLSLMKNHYQSFHTVEHFKTTLTDSLKGVHS